MSGHAAPVIVVRKVVKGHGGHHGGAWKVAYADFVTAMMALFIVLWLMNADEQTKKSIAGFFKDPTGVANMAGSAAAGTGDNLTVQQADMSKLKEKIESVMKSMPELSGPMQSQVQMTVTGEGLRIEMLENETGLFFETGNAQPTGGGRGLLSALATELSKIPNNIVVEGHTDSRPFVNGGSYTNWELSTDRANTARRLLEASGLPTGRIQQVRGFADQRLRLQKEPENASNRRVSIVVEYSKQALKPGRKPAQSGSPPPAESHAKAPPSTHP